MDEEQVNHIQGEVDEQNIQRSKEAECKEQGHEFEKDEDWKQKTEIDKYDIHIPITCKLCGFKAKWVYRFQYILDTVNMEEIWNENIKQS